MAIDREEYDELVRKHTEGDYKKTDPIGELKYIFYLIIVSGILGITIYSIFGALMSLLYTGNISRLEPNAEAASFYGLVISGVLFAISYFAGAAMFMGEMNRRAWTNSQKMDEKHIISDLRQMLSGGDFIRVFFIGSLISFVLFYVFIP